MATPRLVRLRRTFADRRGRRPISGYVVVTTRHPAASANGPEVHRRVAMDNGTIVVDLPPNTYQLVAVLHTRDEGEQIQTITATVAG